MSYSQNIIKPVDTVYIYDGSLAGLFSCVFESVSQKERPATILREDNAQPSLFFVKRIYTDEHKAKRVDTGIEKKISVDALELVKTVFLSALEEKECAILDFLLLAFEAGSKALNMLGNPVVDALMKAQKHLFCESHLLKGFIRFSDYDGVLAATITPKNFVLPFIAQHFVSRYSNEQFLIYDKTHKAALVYRDKKRYILPLSELTLAEASKEEEDYRALWKQFYKTISIKERYNPKCRMTHMPKRYWENMTEMQFEGSTP